MGDTPSSGELNLSSVRPNHNDSTSNTSSSSQNREQAPQPSESNEPDDGAGATGGELVSEPAPAAEPSVEADRPTGRSNRFWAYVSLAGLCIAAVTVFESQAGQPGFELAPNGTTVLCDEADVGDTGEINGTVYTKRTAGQILYDNAATTCTSGITDMSDLFRDDNSFNQDISTWDVSSVEDMGGMFYAAESFNPKYAPEGVPIP